jgi:hypothetical protein
LLCFVTVPDQRPIDRFFAVALCAMLSSRMDRSLLPCRHLASGPDLWHACDWQEKSDFHHDAFTCAFPTPSPQLYCSVALLSFRFPSERKLVPRMLDSPDRSTP